ncbi:unnamed protein product [Miscanthus lutarioriparius]|uniref:Uncharacterized protein n=1 Tax=Miscanthus lutarioriparius TaxID=422564 RepID=A0A811NPG2_9POAL|nr:unnamed protein product [Miscanthus lutarioriparius]
MAGIDLVGARVLPALSSLAACTRPWWQSTPTARQHSTHHHHRTHRVAASSSSFGAATTARTAVRPRATRAHRRSGWQSSSEFACGPSGGRRELVRMWPPEFWKELAWWPTGLGRMWPPGIWRSSRRRPPQRLHRRERG